MENKYVLMQFLMKRYRYVMYIEVDNFIVDIGCMREF